MYQILFILRSIHTDFIVSKVLSFSSQKDADIAFDRIYLYYYNSNKLDMSDIIKLY